MGTRLIHLATRRAWPVLVLSLLVVVLAVVVGGGAVGKLKGGGFDDPASESGRARAALAQTLHQPDANLLLLVTAPDGAGVDDGLVAAQGRGPRAAQYRRPQGPRRRPHGRGRRHHP